MRTDRYLAIDVGGTMTKYALLDGGGELFEKGKIPTVKESQEAFVKSLVSLCEGIRKQGTALSGVAVSCAGFVDEKNGILKNAGTLYCVKDLPLKKILEERLGIPAAVENDARCAALAELWKGALTDVQDAATVILGTAVGGTVIVGRKLLKGASAMAGEFSYLKMNADTPYEPTRDLALYGGVPALLSLAGERLGRDPKTLTGEEVFGLAEAGDEAALSSLRIYAGRLAVLVLNLQFVTAPEKVAFGGGISARPILLTMIREELEKLSASYPYPVPVPKVVACTFGNDANLIGALWHLLAQEKEAAIPCGSISTT